MRTVPRVGGPLSGFAPYLPVDLPRQMCSREAGSKEWCHYVLEDGPLYRFSGFCADLGCAGPEEIVGCDPPEEACDECGTYCTSSKECVEISGLYDEDDE